MQNKRFHNLQTFTKSKLAVLVAALLAFFAATPALQSSGGGNAGGMLEGQFDPGPAGGAGFQIPVYMPPGVRDFQPRLKLQYSSINQDRGMLGVGWDLSGLSQIERCGKRRHLDGHNAPVRYNKGDRLCLDGSRLVGRNGNDNNAYWNGPFSKEVEDWNEIRLHGNCGNGPCRFTVHETNGSMRTYGGAGHARIYARNNTAVRVWLLSEMRDPNGNRIEFKYRSGFGAGTAYIDRIEYEGRGARFFYDRIDDARNINYSYDGTGRTAQRNRLKRIEVFTAAGVFQSYRFSYERSQLTKRSRLRRIDRCDSNNRCLDPMEMSYNDASMNGEFRIVSPGGHVYQDWLRYDPGVNIITGDFNGDGKQDFIRQEKGDRGKDRNNTFNVYLSRGDGKFNIVTPGVNGRQDDPFQHHLRFDPGANIITGDYNGDGKTDFIRQEKNDWDNNDKWTFRVYFSRGNGHFNVVTPNGHAYQHNLRADDGAIIIPGDYNGDGKTDFIRQERGGWDDDTTGTFEVYFSRGNGYFNIVRPNGHVYQDWLRYDPGANIIPGDFNGDGRTDFLRQERGDRDNDANNTFNVYLSRGNGYFDIVTPGGSAFQSNLRSDNGVNIIPGDFNGDGKTDFIRQEKKDWDHDTNNTFNVYFSRGNGHFDVTTPSGGVYQDWLRADPGANIIPLDYNGDGKTDFIRQEKGGRDDDTNNSFNVYVSRGDGTFDIRTPDGYLYQSYLRADPGARLIPGDFDGDGRDDFIRQEKGGWDDDTHLSFGIYFAGAHRAQAADTLKRIVHGPVDHRFTYRRLTEYNANGGINLPGGHRGFLAPFTVLKSYQRIVKTQAGKQTINRHYTYKGAALHPGGRGFVGFRQMHVRGPEENFRTENILRVDFPFTGQTERKTTFNANRSRVLNVEKFQYNKANGLAPQSRIAQLTRKTSEARESSGSRTAVQNIQYDAGNPALVKQTVGSSSMATCTEYSGGQIAAIIRADSCEYSGGSCSCSGVLTEERFERDTSGNVKERRNFDSSRNAWLVERYDYDSRGNRIRTYLPTGAVQTVRFDSTYRTYPVEITTNANGQSYTETLEHDPRNGRPLRETDPNGITARNAYDDFGRLTEAYHTSPSGDEELVGAHQYTRQGNLYVRTTHLLHTWDSDHRTVNVLAVDGLGREIRREEGSSAQRVIVQTEYDVRGSIKRRSEGHLSGESPQWTQYTRDVRGRPVRVTQPGGAVTNVSYAYGGGDCAADQLRVTAVTSVNRGAGRHVTRCRNASNETERLVLRDPVSGASTTHEYDFDALGRMTAARDGQSATNISVDSLGRRVRIESTERGSIEYIYDDRGQLALERRNGEDTYFTYDALNRVTEIVYPDGSRAVYEYDDTTFANTIGRISTAAMVSGAGKEIARREYSYGVSGRAEVIISHFPDLAEPQVIEYRTNVMGDTTSVHYPSGRIACYEYNDRGLLARIDVASGTCADPNAETFVRYKQYTANNQPGLVEYGNGVVTGFEYDGNHRVRGIHTTDAEDVTILEHDYTWTSLNEVESITDDLGDDDAQYTYNGLGYLTRAVGPYGDLSYEYNADGNLIRKDGLNVSYEGSRPEAAGDGRTLEYDAHGNITHRVKNGETFAYEYNGRRKIQRVLRNGKIAGLYEYDAAGDRVTKIDGSGNKTIYVSPEYEITDFAGDRNLRTEYISTPTGRVAAISNEEGIRYAMHKSVQHGLQARAYNTGSVTGLAGFLNHTIMSYAYDPVTIRHGIIAFWALAGAAALAMFVWMLRRPARSAYRRRRMRLAYPAPFVAVTMLAMSISCGGGDSGMLVPPGGLNPGFLFQNESSSGENSPEAYGYAEEGTYYFQYNQVGSTILVTDEAGTPVGRTVYKPYGELYEDASDGRGYFRSKFNDREWDRDAEMYYFNARYYDPATGRFLRADDFLFGTSSDNAAQMNRYAFSANNPITYSDPGGNFAFIPILIAIGIGAAAGAAAGAIAYGISVAMNGGTFNVGDFFKYIAIGAFAGALGGGVGHVLTAAFGASMAATGAVVGATVGTAVDTMVFSILTQVADTGRVDWRSVGIDIGFGLVGAGAGAALGKMGSAASKSIYRGGQKAVSKISSKMSRSAPTASRTAGRAMGKTGRVVGPDGEVLTRMAGVRQHIGRVIGPDGQIMLRQPGTRNLPIHRSFSDQIQAALPSAGPIAAKVGRAVLRSAGAAGIGTTGGNGTNED